MVFLPFWASLALTLAPTILAQESPATPTSDGTPTASTAPSCTASLITTLCDYPSPGPEFAVASSSKESCWAYCNAHQPCSFVIFAAGNPYTGTGTCWLYPGETYDASAGSASGCSNPYLSVFDKPTCAGGTPTSDGGACAAAASPSAIAQVCGYPAPETCFSTCIASEGASSCLEQCAKADECAYAVFNPRTESMSQYSSGTCWIYTNGTFEEGKTTPCSGQAEQFVYENKCPKPPRASASAVVEGAEASLEPSARASVSAVEAAGASGAASVSKTNGATGLAASWLALFGGMAALML